MMVLRPSHYLLCDSKALNSNTVPKHSTSFFEYRGVFDIIALDDIFPTINRSELVSFITLIIHLRFVRTDYTTVVPNGLSPVFFYLVEPGPASLGVDTWHSLRLCPYFWRGCRSA